MRRLFFVLTLAVVGAALVGATATTAAPILNPGDFIIAIDEDPPVVSESAYPGNEFPALAFDDDLFTKYLNFGELTSGLIVTPSFGASIVQSLQIGTANDAVERDPTSFQLWGTNDAILATDDSEGETGETWSLISEGPLALPGVLPNGGGDDARNTLAPVVTFAGNSTSYASYRISFPTVKNTAAANSMQVSEIRLFTSPDGSGDSILDANDDVKAWRLVLPFEIPDSSYPAAENPPRGIDGSASTKYLNFGEENSGFIVTPAGGATTVTSFRIRTANDQEPRDPLDYNLYGTNEAIVSAEHSQGMGETWTLIQSGTLELPLERLTASDVVPVANTTAYTSYKVVFPTTKIDTANSMQLADFQLFDATAAVTDADFDYDGDEDGNDFLRWQRGLGGAAEFTRINGDANADGMVNTTDLAAWQGQFGAAVGAAGAVPEPAAAGLALLGVMALAAARRGRVVH